MVDPLAEIECICECVVAAKPAGFRNDDTALGIAALDDAPGNAGGKFACKQNAGCVERAEDEGGSVASGKHEGSRGRCGEGGADIMMRRAIPIDSVDRTVAHSELSLEM